jgi:hypothetical protein
VPSDRHYRSAGDSIAIGSAGAGTFLFIVMMLGYVLFPAALFAFAKIVDRISRLTNRSNDIAKLRKGST